MPLYTSNFDSETSGSIATGWVAKTGTWAVGTTLPISGAQSFACTSKGSGDTAIYTGAGAIADTIFETAQELAQINQTCAYYMGVRFDTAAANGYLFAFENTGTAGAFQIKFYKKVSGSFTTLNTPTTVLTGAAIGDILHAEVKVVGTAFEVRLWLNGAAKPTSATASFTDSTHSAAGYPALYFGNTTSQSISVDDVIADSAGAAATATLSGGATTGTVGVASPNFTVTLSASSGASTTITLSDSSGGGTFTPASLVITAGNTSGTFTYTAGSTGNKTLSITPNNGYTAAGSPVSFNASAASATSVTLSGATSGTVGVGTTLTATLNGPAGSTTNVTFADSNTGTFSPNPVVISTGGTSGTTTFTPTLGGTHNVTISSSPVLTYVGNPLGFTASAGPVSVATSDSNWFWAPYVWDTVGGSKRSNCCGAYCYLSFTGTSVAINIDVSVFVANSVAAGRYPTVRSSIDTAQTTVTQLTSSTVSISYTGLAAGTHTVRVWFDGAYLSPSPDDRWVTPINALVISGATIDAGASTVAYTPRSKRMIVFSDSTGEGQFSLATGGTATHPTSNSGYGSWVPAVALAFDAEYGQVCYGGQAYDGGGVGGVPAMWGGTNAGSYQYYSSGRSRLVGGVFSPAPDYLVIALGENGAGSTTAGHVQTTITSLRTACGGVGSATKVYVVVPFSQNANATIVTNGYNNYVAAVPGDTNTFLVNLGASWKTGLDVHSGGSSTEQAVDNLHPRQTWNAKLSAALVQKMQANITGIGAGTYPAASVVLTGNSYGPTGAEYTGTVTQPSASNVRSGISYGAGGTALTGTVTLPTAAQVQSGVQFGAGGTQYTGTYAGGGGGTYPTASQVLTGISYGPTGADYTGNITLPAASSVISGTSYGPSSGTNGTVTLPVVANVISGISYGAAGTQYTGTSAMPSVGDVRSGTGYGAGGTQYSGTLSLPAVGDVRSGTQYGTAGTQYTGTLSVGLADQWDSVIEGSMTARQLMRVMSAVLVGRVAGIDANAPVFRSADNSKPRVTAVTDASGNRVAITLDVS